MLPSQYMLRTLLIFWYKSKEARSSLPFIHHEPHSRPVKGSMSPKLKRKTGTKRKKLCYWPVLINAVACLFFGTLTLAVSLHHEIRHCLYQYELSTPHKFVLFFAKKSLCIWMVLNFALSNQGCSDKLLFSKKKIYAFGWSWIWLSVIKDVLRNYYFQKKKHFLEAENLKTRWSSGLNL